MKSSQFSVSWYAIMGMTQQGPDLQWWLLITTTKKMSAWFLFLQDGWVEKAAYGGPANPVGEQGGACGHARALTHCARVTQPWEVSGSIRAAEHKDNGWAPLEGRKPCRGGFWAWVAPALVRTVQLTVHHRTPLGKQDDQIQSPSIHFNH